MSDPPLSRPIEPPKRCKSTFDAWLDGHPHEVQCQLDEGHGGEFHTHERRWQEAEANRGPS